MMTRALLTVCCLGLLAGGCSDDSGTKPDSKVSDAGTDASVVKVTITGTVMDPFGNGGNVGGLKVLEVGASPENATLTDSEGKFTLEIPADQTVTVRVDSDDYLSSQMSLIVAAGGTPEGELFFMVFTMSAITNWIAAASLPAFDEAKGMVALMLGDKAVREGDVPVGQGASLSADSAGSFTVGGDGTAVASDKTIAGGMPGLFFVNVAPGTTTVSYDPTCSMSDAIGPVSDFLVSAKTISLIPSNCGS